MKQVDLKNWEVEVDEKEDSHKMVTMWFGGKAIIVHLHDDGTSSIQVSSHRCDDKHASVSKSTSKYELPSGRKFTCKSTELTSHDTKVEFKKFTV